MSSFSLKYYLNDKALKGKQNKIYGRLIIDRKKAEFYTNFAIDPKDWDEVKNGPKSNFMIKQELLDLENRVFQIRRTLVDQEKIFTPKDIIDILKNRGDRFKAVKLIDYYEQQLQELIDKDESAESTIRHYQGTLKILKMFYKGSNRELLMISDLDYKFIKEFDYYLSAKYISPYNQKLKRNTINKHHARMRTIINLGVKEGLITINPYSNYKFKYEKTHRDYLTQSELDKMEHLDLSDSISLEKVRDIFLFSCNTGVRFQDAQDLTISDIKKHIEGELYIEFKMTKTSEVVAIPLTNQAVSIIEKYAEYSDRIILGSILPQISNQKFNVFVKMIAKAAGIEKLISHHTSRHTFATLALNKGIPIVVVQKLLGHTTVATTEIYAKLVQNTIFNEMKKME